MKSQKINFYRSSKLLVLLTFSFYTVCLSAAESDQSIAKFKTNPASFCDQTMAKRYILANAKTFSAQYPELSGKEITDEKVIHSVTDEKSIFIDEILKKENFKNFNFALGLIPNLKIRATLPESLYRVVYTELEYRYEYVKGGARKLPPPMVERVNAMWEDLWNNPRADRRSPEDIAEGKIGIYTKKEISRTNQGLTEKIYFPIFARMTCAEILGPLQSGCYNEVVFLFDFYNSGMGIYGDGQYRSILDVENYEFVLMNKEHRPYLMLAAKTIFKHFSQVVILKSLNFKPSNLFQDLSESFKKSGMSEEKADKLMWGIIGMLGTAGPGLIERMKFATNAPAENRFAVALIASVLPGLDHVYSNQGLSHYSYPSDVKSNCHTGKSYNFLMSSYLARKMAMETGEPLKAAATVFQAAKAYSALLRKGFTQMRPIYDSSFIKIDTNGPTAEVFRMDLSAYAVGALYGANLTKSHKIDRTYSIDDTILHLQSRKDSGSIKFSGLIEALISWERTYVAKDSLVLEYIKHYYKTLNPNEAFFYNSDVASF